MSLYLLSALVCAFASTGSFYSKVLEQYEKSLEQMKARQKKEIAEVKKAQAKGRDSEMEKLEKNITWCNIKLARNLNSSYWRARLEQLKDEKHFIEIKYDSLLSYIPAENIEGWIERESAKYDIERIKESDRLGRAWTLAEAIKDLWGISEIKAKKLTGIIITFGVELGIILLALLSHLQDGDITHENSKIKIVYGKFGKTSVQNFIEKTGDFFSQNGRLPKASQLSRRNREIRNFLIDKLSENELIELMNSNGRAVS